MMLHRMKQSRCLPFYFAFSILASACGGRTEGVVGPVSSFARQSQQRVDSIDLLLMIDNSASMADKQQVLASAVPYLLTQLVQPRCLDAQGNPTLDDNGQTIRVLLGAGICPNTGTPEFSPVNNIHLGIVTSSLGDHGGDNLCTPGKPTSLVNADGSPLVAPDDVNDQSRLIGTLGRYESSLATTARATMAPSGFLSWGDATNPPMTDGDLTAATGIFTDMVSATGAMGCGLAAPLEAWYRFLIDPVPPIYPIMRDYATQQAARLGSDDLLLMQRAAFLRPDSLLAIVMLTDDDDCSLRDTDVGWVATDSRNWIMTGSSACANNPNDRCCYSCTAAGPPSGCANGCATPSDTARDDGAFQFNLRCWQQKRRFGYEFMYPTSRYVVGLTLPELCPDQSFGDMDCNCTFAKAIGAACSPGARRMPNPLYSNVIGVNNAGNSVTSPYPGAPRADNSTVFLAGIVGVPWQDLGYYDANGNLVYIPVTDSVWTGGAPSDPAHAPITPVPQEGGGIWANIYGNDNDNIVPRDPHMIESLEPRPGIGDNDAIVGHEWNTAYVGLQYACIFPLAAPRTCTCDPGAVDYSSCKYRNANECCDLSFSVDGRGGPGGSYNKPLCNGNVQVNGKAHPGLREIAVLRDYALGARVAGNSIVASACPADVSPDRDQADPGYGYNPAVTALTSQLKRKLKASCLSQPIEVNAQTGAVACNLVEVLDSSLLHQSSCSAFCAANGRVATTAEISVDVSLALQQSGSCDKPGLPACNSVCQCLLQQASTSKNSLGGADSSDLAICQNADDGTTNHLPPGYCYVEPSAGAGSNPNLVSQCPESQRRVLRFVGNNPTAINGASVPLAGAQVFLSCPSSSQ